MSLSCNTRTFECTHICKITVEPVSIVDTNGTDLSALISMVALFTKLYSRKSPYFRGVHILEYIHVHV